jgi:hypothetical protein
MHNAKVEFSTYPARTWIIRATAATLRVAQQAHFLDGREAVCCY